MKILLLCLRFPYPPSDGGTIAMYNMAYALHKAGAQVKILSFNTKKHYVDLKNVPEEFTKIFKPESVYLDATVKAVPAFLNLFSSESYNISRFNVQEFHDKLEEILSHETFDIIQLESLFVTPYLTTIRKFTSAKIVFRAHNVEYIIWERLAASTRNPVKKWYLNLLAAKLKDYELSLLNKFDSIVVLTEDDKNIFMKSGCTIPVLVSPIGLDTEKYQVTEADKSSLSVFHLGSMDWLPNIEAIDWFLEKVYPLVTNSNIAFNIYLAGKNMPQRVFDRAAKNLVVTGKVDDAKKFMHDKAIMIVPLLSGGGMRVKIIEGLAMGKTIISTTIGAEGINYTDGKNIIIANSPEDFSRAILKCVSDLEYCRKIGKEARLLAENVFENAILGKDLLKFYQSEHERKNEISSNTK
ncbi:MAG TPA: glycosyltransferase family 4 protein [Bacteroidia bacterium]|nr:glycosyltransferase family 4 protein [Bacteroidia bacterium]